MRTVGGKGGIVLGRWALTLLVLVSALLLGPLQSESAAGMCASPGGGTVSRPATGPTDETGVSLGLEDTQVRWTRWTTRLVFGESARLEGQVVTDSGAVPGAAVDLFARESGSREWMLVKSAMSDTETGVFSFTCLEPTRSTDYRVVYDGTIYYAGSQGDRRVLVARRVPDALTQTAPDLFRFEGSVRPSYKGRAVLLQRRACTTCRWATVERTLTTSRSGWKFTIDATTFAGQRWFRAVVPGGEDYVRSHSRHTWRITRR